MTRKTPKTLMQQFIATEWVCACGHGESSHINAGCLAEVASANTQSGAEPCGCDSFEAVDKVEIERRFEAEKQRSLRRLRRDGRG